MATGPTTDELVEGMQVLLTRRQEELNTGATPVGWKVGINVPALQAHFGLDGPVVGYLTDATVLAEGIPVDLTGWTHPALEVEVAVRIGGDGGVVALAPALELVDLNLPFDRLGPILEGNVFHRHVIFGSEVSELDVRGLAVRVVSDGEQVAHGLLTEMPDVTVRVVDAFLRRHGATLEPGDRIIAGSLIPPLAVAGGDRLEVSFGPLGSLAVTFSPPVGAPR